MTLADHSDAQVRAWINDVIPELDRWIAHEREHERTMEESFE
jgi:hypothetical protein